jgi:putative NADH-flavin reductase
MGDSMAVAVFGASGATGQAVVAEALSRGWAVRALVRPSTTWVVPRGVTAVPGSLDDAQAIESVMRGATAAVVVFGPRPPFRDVFCAEATAAVLEAMARMGVQRVACQTGAMTAPDRAHVGLGLRALAWAFRRQRPEVAADRVAQEQLVRQSSTRWTLLKPPRLVARPPTGRYLAGPAVRVGLRSSLRLAHLGSLIADCVALDQHVGAAVYARDVT